MGAPFLVPPTARTLPERFAATGNNTGNLLIGDAVARLSDIEIVSAGTVVDVPKLKDSVDLIVIPAANFVSPVMDLSWLAPLIERTSHQILMVGVGAQFPTTRIQDAQLPEVTLRLMRIVSERSHSISVRGQFTADVLAKFGIRNTRVTGCPSLFRCGRTSLSIRKPNKDSFRPVFNGSSNVIRHASSANEARGVELKLFHLGMQFQAPYILQNEFAEMQVSAGLDEGIRGCKNTLNTLRAPFGLDEYSQYLRQHSRAFFNVEEWSAFMAGFDVVVGTRFHGNVMALSQGIAAVPVAHDSRTKELCEALQIPFLSMKSFIDENLDDIVAKLDFSSLERTFPEARSRFADFFLENGIPHRLTENAAEAMADAQRALTSRFAPDLMDQAASSSSTPPPAKMQESDPVTRMKNFLKQKDFESAMLAYEAIREDHPKYVGATLLLAESLLVRDPLRALSAVNKTISGDSGSAKSYWIAARALRNLRRHKESTDMARAGLRIAGDATWIAALEQLL